MDTKPGCLAMNWARSVIKANTSSWLSGGSFTVVIWVTMPSLGGFPAVFCMSVSSWFRKTTPGSAGGFAPRLAPESARRDRFGNRQRAPRHLGVQAFHHAAVERYDAPALILRQVERGDDPF